MHSTDTRISHHKNVSSQLDVPDIDMDISPMITRRGHSRPASRKGSVQGDVDGVHTLHLVEEVTEENERITGIGVAAKDNKPKHHSRGASVRDSLDKIDVSKVKATDDKGLLCFKKKIFFILFYFFFVCHLWHLLHVWFVCFCCFFLCLFFCVC